MNRTAIVTGASRGIGRCISTRLVESGWRVFNLDTLVPENPHEDIWVEVDLSNVKALKEALQQLFKEGPIEGLVNNAGVAQMASLELTSEEDFDLTAAINARAPMQCAKAVVPGMRAQGFGRIVNIASRAHLGKTERTAYAASKGAIISMTKVWALEHAGDGITCNAIAPGPIRTELFAQVNPPEHPRTKAIINTIPVGRIGEPEDIANAVAFFMHENASFVTGQVLYVCGGITLARGGS